ncbi:lectin-like isoform X1 [Huso huso]|uniref:Lectin-like isoform X1 n=1 Tax=Huso huso TaxID=61971 RepID=A0ABR0ZPM5_HUSHU
MEKDAGLDVSALDTALGDLEDSDSTSDITDTDIEDEDGIELDITEDAVDEDRSNMAKASIRYRFFSTQKSFYDAELFCQDRLPHGHLAALTSLSINNQLANLVCHQHGQCTRTFVGGERLQGNRFKWTDGSPWRFTNWMLGEPNNSGSDENCIEIFHNGDRRWNDINCRDKSPSSVHIGHDVRLRKLVHCVCFLFSSFS